jgi:hypothetical protein
MSIVGQPERAMQDRIIALFRVQGPRWSAIADAVRWAEEIMKEIDSRWPAK